MKRKNIIICAGLFMVLFMATVFVGCSDDDETTEVKAPTNLDKSSLMKKPWTNMSASPILSR